MMKNSTTIEKRIQRIVLWGALPSEKVLDSFTFIYNGFYKAFLKLTEDTEVSVDWIYEESLSTDIPEFSKTLFFVEGKFENSIPIVPNSYYVLHNCNLKRYEEVPKHQIIVLQTYTWDADKRWKGSPLGERPFHFYHGSPGKTGSLYMPWATDSLPHEISEQIERLVEIDKNIINQVYFVGQPTEPWDQFEEVCKEKNIQCHIKGGYSRKVTSYQDHKRYIESSCIAPALQCTWQVENGYIPCRIFKNISYGKMGMTNNPAVFELFDGKVLFSKDVRNLIDQGIKFNKDPNRIEIIRELMEYVREHHTYISRIKALYELFDIIDIVNQ